MTSSSSAARSAWAVVDAPVDAGAVGARRHERVARAPAAPRRRGSGRTRRAGRRRRDVAVVPSASRARRRRPSACHVVADGEDRHAVVGDGVERVGQRLLEPGPLVTTSVAPSSTLAVAQRRLERVGVAAGGDDRADVEAAVAGDARRRCRPRCPWWRRCSRRRPTCRRGPRAAGARRRHRRRSRRAPAAVPTLEAASEPRTDLRTIPRTLHSSGPGPQPAPEPRRRRGGRHRRLRPLRLDRRARPELAARRGGARRRRSSAPTAAARARCST